MLRSSPIRALLLLAPLAAACGGNNSPTTPTAPTPVAVTEQFSGRLTRNGGVTHEFTVQQAGTVTARITALAPDEAALIGLAIGTWNGLLCQQTLPNDKATLNTTVTGSAQNTGLFCVRVYDAAGTLTDTVEYTIDVTHF